MENYEEEEMYEQERAQSPELVMGYNEGQERGRAGANIMGSQIDGSGVLARAQERMEQRAGSAPERKLLQFFRQISDLYRRFAPNDEVLVVEGFRNLNNPSYKNPYAYLLAYIGRREVRPLTREWLEALYGWAVYLEVPSLSREDIIRYYRLLSKD